MKSAADVLDDVVLALNTFTIDRYRRPIKALFEIIRAFRDSEWKLEPPAPNASLFLRPEPEALPGPLYLDRERFDQLHVLLYYVTDANGNYMVLDGHSELDTSVEGEVRFRLGTMTFAYRDVDGTFTNLAKLYAHAMRSELTGE